LRIAIVAVLAWGLLVGAPVSALQQLPPLVPPAQIPPVQPTTTSPPPAQPGGAQPAPFPTQPAPASTPAPPSAAETPDPTPAAGQVTEQVTKEGLDQLKSRVDAATDLSETQRQQANEFIEKARVSLQQSIDHGQSLTESRQRTESIESERRAELSRADAALREQSPPSPAYVPLPQLEQNLASRQQELVQAQTELAQAEKRLTDRTARQRTIKERLAAIPLQVDQVKTDLAKPNPGTEPALVVEARRLFQLAELRSLTTEPAALQAESAFLTAQESANLIQLRRQTLNATVARLKDEVAALQIRVEQERSSDTQSRLTIARREAESTTIPQLRELHEANIKAVESELRIRERQRLIAQQVATVKGTIETIQQKWGELRQREEKKLGSSTSFGIRLLEQRRFLPNVQALQQEIRDRAALNEQARLDYIETREKRAELDHLNRAIESLLNSISSSDDTPDQRRHLEDEIREAYEQFQSNLSELETSYESYVASLDQLDLEQSTLIQQVTGFQKYIDERILWVPTHRVLTLNNVVADYPSLKRLVSFDAWEEYRRAYMEDLRARPLLYFIAALVWTILLVTQRRQAANIKGYGQKAGSRLNTSMSPTWGAMIWSFLKTLARPFPILFLAWRGYNSTSAVHEFAHGLLIIGFWFWWLEAVRITCRPGGLGAAHFQWSERVNRLVSRQLSSFVLMTIPLTLIIIGFRNLSTDGETDALQRCCVILFLLLIAYTLNRLTLKKSGVFLEWTQENPKGWGSLFIFLFRLIVIILPLFLAGLSFTGYTFAQSRLTLRLGQTLMLVTGAIFARSLLFRWLTIRQRRLAIAHAREVREALVSAQGQEEGSSAAVLEAQEARANLTEVSTQSKRLLNTTIVTLCLCWIWLIWQDVLPALQRLDQFSLPGTPFTMDKVFNAILEIVLFTTASRNIPGLIEITLLERLPLDRSSRYAVGAILRYIIALFGVLVIGKTLGLKWESLQWLVAALTFSLGFGLQEIFANFVSGIIILFEQPIRVGDVVTLDNVTGTVNRIRIRSTSIIDYDRKEYIVPNKEFITGKVLNWTLTDTINRVVIHVGTSYEADPNQVREILRNIIKTQPHVLTDPAPFVNCNGIQDGSLSFIIGVYLPSLEFRSETSHAIHARIHQAFREAGIELATPQRILHVRNESHSSIAEPLSPRIPPAPPKDNVDKESETSDSRTVSNPN